MASTMPENRAAALRHPAPLPAIHASCLDGLSSGSRHLTAGRCRMSRLAAGLRNAVGRAGPFDRSVPLRAAADRNEPGVGTPPGRDSVLCPWQERGSLRGDDLPWGRKLDMVRPTSFGSGRGGLSDRVAP